MNPLDNLIQFMKARRGEQVSGAKYYKRIPTGNPKRPWKYYYTQVAYEKDFPPSISKGSVWDRISSFFGIDKSKSERQAQAEYQKNNISGKGIALSDWVSHFNKYFEQKDKIDASFNQEKTVTQAAEFIAKQNVIPKESNPEKKIYKKSIFKILYDLYGNKSGISTQPSDNGILNGSVEGIPSQMAVEPTQPSSQNRRQGTDSGKSSLTSSNSELRSSVPILQRGIDSEESKKALNQVFPPKLEYKEVKTGVDFIELVRALLEESGLSDKAQEWLNTAYASDTTSISDILNKSYKFVQIPSDIANKFRKDLKTDTYQKKIKNAVEAVEVFKEKWSQKKQSEINAQCREILNSTLPENITEEQKAILRQYEGSGGQSTNENEKENKGMLYEFFTPRKIIEKMQNILTRYLPEGGDVLEPSAGIGRFAEGEGSKFNWDMLQYNPDDDTAYRIAKILHPESDIKDKAFEQLFIDDRNRSVGKNYKGKLYKGVGGNPPYGSMEGKFKAIEGKGWNRYENYFISRGLDVLEEGGVLTYIVPQSFMNAGSSEKWKQEIFGKAELLEAYRLPEGAFGNTQIGTDVIVLRKNTSGTQDNRLAFGGEYFKENPDHQFGEELERKNRFGREEKFIKGKADDFINFQFPEPKPMSQAQKDAISKGLIGNQNAKGERGRKIAEDNKRKNKATSELVKTVKQVTGKPVVDPSNLFTQEEFQEKYGKKFDKKDIEIIRNLSPTGEISKTLPFDPSKMAKMNGEHYPLYTYGSGDIREKLQQLELDKDAGLIDSEQYSKQKKFLNDALPKPIELKNIILNPIESFARGFQFSAPDDEGNVVSLIGKFKEYLRGKPVKVKGYRYGTYETVYQNPGIPQDFFNGYTAKLSDVLDYLDGTKVTGRNELVWDKESGTRIKLDTNKEKKKERKELGDKLFLDFLNEVLTPEERSEIEEKWNAQYNSNVKIDGSKIPVLLEGMTKLVDGKVQDMRNTQINFLSRYMVQGVGCATHEVGLGKTWTGIAASVSSLQAGKCKKPLTVVPTSVLQQWEREFKSRFPNVPLNVIGTPELNKLSKEQGGKYIPPDGQVTIMSYDAFAQFGFADERYDELTKTIKDQISNPDASDSLEKSKRKSTKETEKAESVVSIAIKGTRDFLKFDEAGFDMLIVDEAHNFNNIFVDQQSRRGNNAVSEPDNEDEERVNEFAGITSGGTSSARGIKLWLAARHILEKNNDQNVLMLTATPFTNNPLQIYSLLSMIAKKRLEKMGIFSVRDFLAAFITTKNENVIEGNGRVENKQVIKNFKNAHALQSLIAEYFDFQTGDANGVKRPKLKMKAVTLPLSEEMMEIRNSLEAMYDIKDENGKPLEGAALVAIQAQQMLNVSPALVKKGKSAAWEEIGEINKNGDKDFVGRSPKLKFIADSIAGFYKKFKEAKPGERIPGQIMFLPKGVEYMNEVKKYLVEVHGIDPDAIELLTADTKKQKPKDTKNAGTGITRFTEISDNFNSADHPCKIVIGSDVIKEGVSLQKNTAVAYNSSIDWNPTTEVQKRGRHHRPGNLLDDVMWVDVLMEDSIDSKLYQKQSEKISRINQVFEKTGDAAIDVSDINPEELKTDIIRDPARKAQFVVNEEMSRLNKEARDLNGKGLVIEKLASEIEEAESVIKEYNESLAESKAELKKMKEAIALNEKGESFDHLGLDEWDIKPYRVKSVEDDVKRFSTKISEQKYILKRNTMELENKGFKTIEAAKKKSEEILNKAKAMLEDSSRDAKAEKIKVLSERFIKELAEKEKNRVRDSLDSIVSKQVAEVLQLVGINDFQKSFSGTNLRAKHRIYQFMKGRVA